MAGRRCPGHDLIDGRLRSCPIIIGPGQRYCARHARANEQRRGTRQDRGYDAAHERLRNRIQASIDGGADVRCATCNTRLHGRAWDLGHTDDRTMWLGPQCLPCNRGEAGRHGAAVSNASR